MKKLLLAATAAVSVAIVGPALAQTAAPAPSAKAGKAMSRADITQRVQRQFVRLDANKDGFVTQAEAQAAAGQRAQRMQQRDAKTAERAQNRAQRLDPARIFAKLDANRDGQVTRAEAEAARTAVAARKGKSTNAHAVAMGGLFERGDTNRDGSINRAEFDALHALRLQRMAARGAKQHQAFAGRMFAGADANKDGRLTLQEATAMSLQRFDKLDANRDGTITPEERQQRRQQRRAATPRG